MTNPRVAALVIVAVVVVLLAMSFLGAVHCRADNEPNAGKKTPEQVATDAITNGGIKPMMAGVQRIFSWTLFVVEALLALLILHRGILIVAGGPEAAENAKGSLKNIFVGFLVLYGIGIILTTLFWVGGIQKGSELWKMYLPFGVPWSI